MEHVERVGPTGGLEETAQLTVTGDGDARVSSRWDLLR
jgi:hypothetical protein